MKARTQLIAIALIAGCAGWARQASALEVWWGPLPANLQTDITTTDLAPVGERIAFAESQDISPEKMAQIQDALASRGALQPVGESLDSNLYPHVWPVGAVGRPRLIYVPVPAPAPVGERITVTQYQTTAPVRFVRNRRVVYRTTRHLAPVGERITTRRVIIHRARAHTRLAPVGEWDPFFD